MTTIPEEQHYTETAVDHSCHRYVFIKRNRLKIERFT